MKTTTLTLCFALLLGSAMAVQAKGSGRNPPRDASGTQVQQMLAPMCNLPFLHKYVACTDKIKAP